MMCGALCCFGVWCDAKMLPWHAMRNAHTAMHHHASRTMQHAPRMHAHATPLLAPGLTLPLRPAPSPSCCRWSGTRAPSGSGRRRPRRGCASCCVRGRAGGRGRRTPLLLEAPPSPERSSAPRRRTPPSMARSRPVAQAWARGRGRWRSRCRPKRVGRRSSRAMCAAACEPAERRRRRRRRRRRWRRRREAAAGWARWSRVRGRPRDKLIKG